MHHDWLKNKRDRAEIGHTNSRPFVFLPRLSTYPLLPRTTMSFALLRAPLRRAAFSGAIPRATVRTSYRKFSTPTPPPAPKAKSNNGLFIGLGAAVAVGGLAVYLYSDSTETGTAVKSGIQAAKVKANFVPTKEDYQKVRYF